MDIVGVVTIPVRGSWIAVPIQQMAYANRDAPRAPGGLFIDEDGQLGIVVDARAPQEVQRATALASAWQAYQILAPRMMN